MSDVLLSFIQSNSGVNYSFVLPAIIGYLIIFWLIVSYWVFWDAKKRFHNKKIGVLVGIACVIFQLPFLLLYLLFRPIEEELMESTTGGVNVPIINFTDKEGVVMSLELRINHEKLMPEDASEMKIDVSFDTKNNPNATKVEPMAQPVTEKSVITLNAPESKTNPSLLLNRFRNFLNSRKKKQNNDIAKVEPNKNKKKKKNKKNRKK